MKVETQSNQVYLEIRKKILSNQLAGNTRLKEEFWAKKLNVNRIAVREGLNRLQGENMVIAGKKGGYFVKPMTREGFHELRELREILELGALRLAIRKMNSEHFNKLDKICDAFTAMIKESYYNGALEADMKFHETLMEFSGNKNLLRAYQLSHIPLFHQKIGETQIEYSDHELTDIEHRAIVMALKEKNIKLAEETLIKHFARGEAAVFDLE